MVFVLLFSDFSAIPELLKASGNIGFVCNLKRCKCYTYNFNRVTIDILLIGVVLGVAILNLNLLNLLIRTRNTIHIGFAGDLRSQLLTKNLNGFKIGAHNLKHKNFFCPFSSTFYIYSFILRSAASVSILVGCSVPCLLIFLTVRFYLSTPSPTILFSFFPSGLHRQYSTVVISIFIRSFLVDSAPVFIGIS